MKNLTPRSKTIAVQMSHASVEGAVYGFLIMSEVIMRREMNAAPFMIALFTMVMPVSALFSIYFSHILSVNPGRIKLFIFLAALFTRLPMALFFIFDGPVSLLVLTLLHFMGDSFIKPVQNIYMKMNYAKKEIGRIFAYSISANKVLFIAAAYAFGKWLDTDGSVYVIIFSLSGVVSFLSLFMLAMVPFDGWSKEKQVLQKMDLYIFPTIKKVFSRNREFFIYEAAFFIYGGGFMVILAAIPIMLVDYLDLSYSIISFGRGVVSAVVIITLMPILGRIFDRRDPVFMGMAAFAVLIGHPLTIIFAYFAPAELSKYFIYLSYTFFGMGMAAVTLCWNLGPMYFAKNNMEVPELTSTHVTLTGIRGLIWPFSGYLLLKIHILLPFIASIIFLVVATLIMRSLHKRPKNAIHPEVEPAGV
jgi:hypothetical protein